MYSTCRFDFVSSYNRKPKEYIPACVVTNEFLTRIGPSKIARMQSIYCDLDWERRAMIANYFFSMLGAMLLFPTTSIGDINFEFKAGHKATVPGEVYEHISHCASLSVVSSASSPIFSL